MASPAERHRGQLSHPQWFEQFMADRAIRKPSPHTSKAYRQDFEAIALLLCDTPHDLHTLPPEWLTKDAMRLAFASYAKDHAAASIRRCWSTWNTICTFLFTAEVIPANPMPLIGRPRVPKSLPKGLPDETVASLVTAIDTAPPASKGLDWPERDRAILFTALLAGLPRRN